MGSCLSAVKELGVLSERLDALFSREEEGPAWGGRDSLNSKLLRALAGRFPDLPRKRAQADH